MCVCVEIKEDATHGGRSRGRKGAPPSRPRWRSARRPLSAPEWLTDSAGPAGENAGRAFDHPETATTEHSLLHRGSAEQHSRSLRALAGDTCSSTPTTHNLQSGSFGIGKGFSGPGYANAQSCKYIVKDDASSGGMIGVAFTFFHTEANQDVVKIYDHAADPSGTGTPLATYSGDLTTPLLFAVCVRELLIVFTADEQVHPTRGRAGLSVKARCPCSLLDGPTCSHGSCAMKDTSSAPAPGHLHSDSDNADWYLGATCGTKVPHLVPVDGTAAFDPERATVSPLAVGSWSYLPPQARQSWRPRLVDFKHGSATDLY